MRKKLLVLLLCCSTLTFQFACTSDQVASAVEQVSAFLPSVTAAAQAIAALGDPQASQAIQAASNIVSTDLPALRQAIAAYQSAPSSDKFGQIVAGWDAMLNAFDPAMLAANRLLNPQTQQKTLLALAALSTALHTADSILIAVQSRKQQKQHASQHAVALNRVAPYFRQELVPQYNVAAAVRYEEALGF